MAITPSFVSLKLTMYQNNTQLLKITGLRDSSQNFITDAALLATLLDQNRSQVQNCIDISVPYVTGSNGDYQGTIPSAFEAPVGTEYTMVIDGDGGGGHLHLEIPTEVKVRSS